MTDTKPPVQISIGISTADVSKALDNIAKQFQELNAAHYEYMPDGRKSLNMSTTYWEFKRKGYSWTKRSVIGKSRGSIVNAWRLYYGKKRKPGEKPLIKSQYMYLPNGERSMEPAKISWRFKTPVTGKPAYVVYNLDDILQIWRKYNEQRQTSTLYQNEVAGGEPPSTP